MVRFCESSQNAVNPSYGLVRESRDEEEREFKRDPTVSALITRFKNVTPRFVGFKTNTAYHASSAAPAFCVQGWREKYIVSKSCFIRL